MSHVYSFCLFSIILFFLEKWIEHPHRLRYPYLLSVLVGLILVVRPTNIFFIIFAVLTFTLVLRKPLLKHLLGLRFFDFFILIGLCLLPVFMQMAYWKYAFGQWLVYSYKHETFQWLSPDLLTFLFAPMNVLFLYTPFYLVMLTSFIYLILHWQYVAQGLMGLFIFIFLSYVFFKLVGTNIRLFIWSAGHD